MSDEKIHIPPQYLHPAAPDSPTEPYQVPHQPQGDEVTAPFQASPSSYGTQQYGAYPAAYPPGSHGAYQASQYAAQPSHGQQSPDPKPAHGWSGGAVVASAVAGAVIGGIIMAAGMFLVFGFPQTSVQSARPAQQAVPLALGGTSRPVSVETTEPDQPVEAVAAKVTPSVVNISIQQTVNNPWSGQSGGTQTVGNGSGVIIRSDGYILTNNHVVENADRVLVRIGLQDVPAKVIGTDPSSDIAVVKVDKTGLTPAVLGDSEALRVGEQVVAIGSPFGLDKTVTSGIISALHRSGQSGDQFNSTYYANLIQTDAPINPGNSGGALSDLSGKVIGINTLIQTGGAQQSAGIGFAIPIKLAAQVAEQLIATGKASHAFLGVSAVSVDDQSARQLGLKVTSGALVQDVQSGSPAAGAGIKQNDVIVKIDDQSVATSQDMVAAVRAHKPGDRVPVVLDRAGKTIGLTVTLGTATQ